MLNYTGILSCQGLCLNWFACRGYDGKLGRHAHHPGQLKLQETIVFSSGQSKPVLHTDIHSIQSTGQDPPVTLVLRLKDGAAKSRYTSCFMANNDNAMVAKYICWTDRKEDRPCTESEKSSMLMVRPVARVISAC